MLEQKMSHKIRNGLRAVGIISIVILFASMMITVFLWKSVDVTRYDNETRIRINEKEEQYPRMEFDLEGRVSRADPEFHRKAGEKVNVQEMLQRDRYSKNAFPGMKRVIYTIQKNGRVTGFCVYLVPEEELASGNIQADIFWKSLPLITGAFLVLGCLIWVLYLVNRRFLRSIEKISISASRIVHGDYDYEVLRVYDKKLVDHELGTLVYSFEMMRDELKAGRQKEEEIKKSQQELISCISHDLKTPLSTIKAYAEGMRDGIAKTEESRKKYTEIIIAKTDTIIGMTEELLKYSNTQLNRLDIQKKEVYFKAFFTELMQEVGIFVENAGIAFSSELHMEDCLVEMDERRIGEVVYNLVENSMKYRKKEAPKLHISARYEKDFVMIGVKDNGIGIDLSDIPYVFDKFYRAEKSRSSSIPGSGLGLSICKYIVEQHGGKITCQSKKGDGCEMSFTIAVHSSI